MRSSLGEIKIRTAAAPAGARQVRMNLIWCVFLGDRASNVWAKAPLNRPGEPKLLLPLERARCGEHMLGAGRRISNTGPLLLSLKDAARALSISYATIYQMMSQG